MNLPKAKEILNLYLTHSYQGDEQDLRTARHLGIEALQRLLFMRSYNIPQAIAPLPSESED